MVPGTSHDVFKRMVRLVFVLWIWVTSGGAAAAEPVTEQRYQARLQTVEALLAADMRLAAEMGEASRGELASVRDDIARAKQAWSDQSGVEAMQALDRAYRTLQQLIGRRAESRSVQEPVGSREPVADQAAQREQFDRLLLSVNALLEAYKRIATEQGGRAALAPALEAIIAQAGDAAAAGEWSTALGKLNDAYTLLRQLIAQAREGKTLVRSLSFASPEEEYAYETEHLANLFVVTELLTRDRRQDPRAANQMDAAIGSAGRHRAQAAELAEQRQYSEAVKEMEAAGAQLMRAIRVAGIYLP